MSSKVKRKHDDIADTDNGVKKTEEEEEKKKRKIQRCDTQEVNDTADSISALKTKSPQKRKEEGEEESKKEETTTTTKPEDASIESGFLAFTNTNPWGTTSVSTSTSFESDDKKQEETNNNNTSWEFSMDGFNSCDTTNWDFSGYETKKNDDKKEDNKEESTTTTEKKDNKVEEETTTTTLTNQRQLSNGEDNERVLCESGQVKLYRLDSDTSEWVSCGEGRARINVPSSKDNGELPRIIMRNNGTNRVILNDILRSETEFKRDGTRIRITFVRPDSSVTFVLKFARNAERASEFAKAMTTLQNESKKKEDEEK